jgi:excisionase family DNA binding protein
MTIIRWITEGRIKAYKTPGGHRRIMRQDLEIFCHSAGIPLEWETSGSAGVQKVLIIDDDPDEVSNILDALVDADGTESTMSFQVETADNAFDAGRLLMSSSPEVIFLDLDLPGVNAHSIVSSIRAEVTTSSSRIVGIRSERTPQGIPVDRELARPLGKHAVRQATGPMPIIKLPR